MSNRVSFYIDGYNLYRGLLEKHGRKWLWLDLGGLCRSILWPNQTIETIHYCTAQIRDDPAGVARQRAYWAALRTIPEVQIHLGFFARRERRCRDCQKSHLGYEEKKTDSRIASLMVADALSDRTDVLILIGGDSDHVPPVETVRKECPEKKVLVVWPPARKSKDLADAVGLHFHMRTSHIRRAQFPKSVRLNDGNLVLRPPEWVS